MRLHIRQERLKKGLSLNELSKKTGISISYLSDIEAGKRENLSIKKLCKIAQVLNVDITDLVDCEKGEMI